MLEINVDSWLDNYSKHYKDYNKNDLESNKRHLALLYRYMSYCYPSPEELEYLKDFKNSVNVDIKGFIVDEMPQGCLNCKYCRFDTEDDKSRGNGWCLFRKYGSLGRQYFFGEYYKDNRIEDCPLRKE